MPLSERWALSINVTWGKVVVIGYGSIGKRHLASLRYKSQEIWVVDPRDISKEVPPNVNVTDDLESVRFAPDNNSLAVVANWGPDHFITVEKLAKAGFRNIVLEKPMVTSLHSLKRMLELEDRYELRIAVNQGWHFSDLYDALSEIENRNNMGAAVAIWSVGGARCLSTTGSHIIHMANRVFKSESVEFTSSLKMEKINPRAQHLDYVEGVASIHYLAGQRLSLSYTNSSAIEGSTFIYWRNFCAEIDARGSLKIMTNSNLQNVDDPITRYSPGKELIFDTNLEPNLYKIDNMESLHEHAFRLLNVGSDFEFKSHADSAFDLLMLLNSSVEKRTLTRQDANSKNILERNFMVS